MPSTWPTLCRPYGSPAPLTLPLPHQKITAMVTTVESPFSQKGSWELVLASAGHNGLLPYEGTIFVAAVRALVSRTADFVCLW